ncbi:MAG: BON domain-containing protein [Desulfobulbaceae bacterium]|nr:BON domain-containing protein [Desulfobulbaceae bacterium]
MVCKTISLFPLVLLFLLLHGTPLSAGDNPEGGSDIWLEAQLVTSYTLNEHLNPFKISVDVKDGIANITGSVDSEIERDLAVEIARSIDGIREVKEDLKIGPAEDAREKKSEFARRVEDATVTAKVKYRLILNKHIASYDINVDTENSVVTLTGRVDSGEKRDLIVKLAENTSGVAQVKDNLIVTDPGNMRQEGQEEMPGEKPGSTMQKRMDELSQDMKDTWITTKARSLLLVSNEAEGARYDITTKDGRITVTGTVKSEQQAGAIRTILEDMQGVREVETQLAVHGEDRSG